MFGQSPSQILMTLVEEATSDGEERVASYAELQNRLTALGMEIEEGQSPEEAYKQAEHLFRRSRSSYHSEALLAPAVKEKAG